MLLCSIYRPPTNRTEFWENLQASLSLAKESNISKVVIAGDLNADLETQQGETLRVFAEANHLFIHIDMPTRITPTSSTILDQFMSNIPDFVKKSRVETPLYTNDHLTIGLDLLFRIDKAKAYSRVMWDFKNSNFDSFRTELASVDFSAFFESDDVNEACKKLNTAYSKGDPCE